MKPILTLLALAALTGSALAQTRYPITIQNCGRAVTFTKAPERVVTLYQGSAELMVALGLQDRIVQAFTVYDDVLPELAQGFRNVKLYTPRFDWPTREVLLATNPDFVLADGFGAGFDESRGQATVQQLEAAGIKVLSFADGCSFATPSSPESIYTDIENLGRIFGVQQRARALINRLKTRMAQVQARIRVSGQRAPRVAFYWQGEGAIGVFTGSYVLGKIITRAGGVNVFERASEQSFAQVSVEAFAQAAPEIIIVGEFEGGTPAAKQIEFLKKTFPNIPAVRNNRFVQVRYPDFELGLRSANAVEQLARAFYPTVFR